MYVTSPCMYVISFWILVVAAVEHTSARLSVGQGQRCIVAILDCKVSHVAYSSPLPSVKQDVSQKLSCLFQSPRCRAIICLPVLDRSFTLDMATSDDNMQPVSSEKQAPDSPNKFVRFWRHVYHPLGFRKGYNFPLCVSPPPKHHQA